MLSSVLALLFFHIDPVVLVHVRIEVKRQKHSTRDEVAGVSVQILEIRLRHDCFVH